MMRVLDAIVDALVALLTDKTLRSLPLSIWLCCVATVAAAACKVMSAAAAARNTSAAGEDNARETGGTF